MKDYDSGEFKRFTSKSEFNKALHVLQGVLTGIAFDKKANNLEIKELKNWCLINERFSNKPPFNELIPMIESALEDGEISKDEIDDIIWVCNNFDNGYYDIVTSDIQRLQGILHGIISDNKINNQEIIELRNWLHENDHLENTYPYDEIYSLIVSVLSDGQLHENEIKLLKAFFSQFIDTDNSCTIDKSEISELKNSINIGGICTICPSIKFENMAFCFTGESSKTTRAEIRNVVESLNGVLQENVNKKTNYLVVGNNGNPCWAFSCYGRKVEKAMELRKQGSSILIVHENDFWDAIEDLKLKEA